MKKFLVLVPLATIVVAQAIRIEHVTAEEPVPAAPQPSSLPDTSTDTTIQRPDAILPPYVIEPPDILLLNAIKLVPKSPHLIEPFDALLVRVTGALPDQPIADAFAVDSDGKIDLGPNYGRIEVGRMTVDDARAAIQKQLKVILQDPQVSVSIAHSAAAQQIQGEHLVGPDGRVNLGVYGTVYVAGLTIEGARVAIEKQLAKELVAPKVVVEVFAYNSKKYYIITRGAKKGDNVTAAPITGNDTVLDALALVDDALKQSSTKIWISRPTDNGAGDSKILPVNWNQIVDGTSTATNYQLLAGDRLFVVSIDPAGDLSHVAEPATTSSTPATPSPFSATAPTYLPPGYVPNRVEFSIEILEDRESALAEYDTLRNGMPYVAVDSATIGPALRVLASHGLIKKFAAPKISCNIGDSATMSTDSLEGYETPEIDLRLIATRSRDQGNVVLTRLLADYDGEKRKLEFAAYGATGKTILVPIPVPKATETKRNSVYLAITPSFPVTLPTSSDDSYYFPKP